MKVIYAPKGEEPQEFVFKPRDTLSMDAEALEDVGGDLWNNYDEFLGALGVGKFRALRAVLWINLRRSRPELTFAELVVGVSEVNYGPDDEEVAEIRQRIAEDEDLSDALREQLLRDLGGKDDGGSGSPTADADTDVGSLTPASAA